MHSLALFSPNVHVPSDFNTNFLMITRWIHFLAGITWIGLLGSAISSDIAYGFYVAGHLWVCKRLLDVPLRPIGRDLLRCLVAAAASWFPSGSTATAASSRRRVAVSNFPARSTGNCFPWPRTAQQAHFGTRPLPRSCAAPKKPCATTSKNFVKRATDWKPKSPSELPNCVALKKSFAT